MQEARSIRKSLSAEAGYYREADHSRHIGFEKLSMENVHAVLQGNPPLTPVNQHLLAKKTKANL